MLSIAGNRVEIEIFLSNKIEIFETGPVSTPNIEDSSQMSHLKKIITINKSFILTKVI